MRGNLIENRDQSALSVASVNARQAERRIFEGATDKAVRDFLSNLRGVRAESTPVLRLETDWISADPVVFAAPDSIDAKLLEVVNSSPLDGAKMKYRMGNGTPVLVVGFPLATRNALYFEATPLDDIEDTLDSLANILMLVSGGVFLFGIALGMWSSRRVLFPVEEVGQTARAIAVGDLSARLDVGKDPDLEMLASTFNQMANTLEQRIEADAKFASNVSHELRSPLTTIMASIEVLNGNADSLDENSKLALSLLNEDLERFKQLVEDLLEISRYDVGANALTLERFLVVEFLERLTEQRSSGVISINFPFEINDILIEADKRRLARVLSNLLDNADHYAGGATHIEVRADEDTLILSVIDNGPGITQEDRSSIFERFARGTEGSRRGSSKGTGLGLSLVTEHVKL
ncbi:MAG: HAMP domain-containing sensor histidine kinase, partial [Actinomycetota bacterium]|nr:HAMP domain-containing sensor histidine kinase [Actinomycetota bacterium]